MNHGSGAGMLFMGELSVVRTFGTTRGVDQRSVGLVSD